MSLDAICQTAFSTAAFHVCTVVPSEYVRRNFGCALYFSIPNGAHKLELKCLFSIKKWNGCASLNQISYNITVVYTAPCKCVYSITC